VAVYFVDTSALAKRYIAETGSSWLRVLLDPTSGCTVFVARVTAVEIIAAITRRERGGAIVPADAIAARSAFRADLAAQYQVIEVTRVLSDRAMTLAETHGLRGYDAVQLAGALEANARYIAVGLPAIVLVSADAELNTAALAEGLPAEDPNTHP
jgi:predicted nucleic acid-binding protein